MDLLRRPAEPAVLDHVLVLVLVYSLGVGVFGFYLSSLAIPWR
ncbi:hypothetical protein [Saccharopolyspora spinosa]|nr:hypothetical protein [Saccharopolyspora spinosa]